MFLGLRRWLLTLSLGVITTTVSIIILIYRTPDSHVTQNNPRPNRIAWFGLDFKVDNPAGYCNDLRIIREMHLIAAFFNRTMVYPPIIKRAGVPETIPSAEIIDIELMNRALSNGIFLPVLPEELLTGEMKKSAVVYDTDPSNYIEWFQEHHDTEILKFNHVLALSLMDSNDPTEGLPKLYNSENTQEWRRAMYKSVVLATHPPLEILQIVRRIIDVLGEGRFLCLHPRTEPEWQVFWGWSPPAFSDATVLQMIHDSLGSDFIRNHSVYIVGGLDAQMISFWQQTPFRTVYTKHDFLPADSIYRQNSHATPPTMGAVLDQHVCRHGSAFIGNSASWYSDFLALVFKYNNLPAWGTEANGLGPFKPRSRSYYG